MPLAAYFHNLLVPGARADAVIGALSEWYSAAGYARQTGRLLFDHQFQQRDERVFVISNEKACLLIGSHSFDEKSKLFQAFAAFPALVELWARDGAWGCILQERGKTTALYHSKSSGVKRARSNLSVPDDLKRLAEICGTPGALPVLGRAQKMRTFFLEKKCGAFAVAIGAPLAIYRNFSELDRANAGITEARQVQGWNCQLLCFRKTPPDPEPPSPIPSLKSLSPEQREQFQRAQKRLKWIGWLLRPLTIIAGLVVFPLLLIIGGPVLFSLVYLSRILFLRKCFLGDATCACEDFLKKLEALEPKRLVFQGDRVINTRHGCSIAIPKSVTVLTKPLPHKGPALEQSIFELKFGKDYFICAARPTRGKFNLGQRGILEERTITVSGFEVRFQKRSSAPVSGNSRYIYYDWELEAPQAVYDFSSTTQRELTPADFEILENIVRSFKLPDAISSTTRR